MANYDEFEPSGGSSYDDFKPKPKPKPRPKRTAPARTPKVVKVQTRQQPARLDGMTFGLPMPSLMRTPAPKPQAPLHEAVRKPFPKAKPIQQDESRTKPAPKAKVAPKSAPKRNRVQAGKDAVVASSPVVQGFLNTVSALKNAPEAIANLPSNIASLPGTLERQAKGLWEQTVRPAMEHMGAAQTLGSPGASPAAFAMEHGRPDIMESAQGTYRDPVKTAAAGRVVANTLPLMALGAASKPVQLAAGAAFGVPSAINLNKRRTGELPGFWEDPVMTAMDAAGVALAPFAARGFVNSIRGLRTPTLPIERVLEPPVPVAEGMREPLLTRRGAPVVREPAPAGTFVRKPAGTRMEKGAPLRRRATEKAPVEQARPMAQPATPEPVPVDTTMSTPKATSGKRKPRKYVPPSIPKDEMTHPGALVADEIVVRRWDFPDGQFHPIDRNGRPLPRPVVSVSLGDLTPSERATFMEFMREYGGGGERKYMPRREVLNKGAHGRRTVISGDELEQFDITIPRKEIEVAMENYRASHKTIGELEEADYYRRMENEYYNSKDKDVIDEGLSQYDFGEDDIDFGDPLAGELTPEELARLIAESEERNAAAKGQRPASTETGTVDTALTTDRTDTAVGRPGNGGAQDAGLPSGRNQEGLTPDPIRDGALYRQILSAARNKGSVSLNDIERWPGGRPAKAQETIAALVEDGALSNVYPDGSLKFLGEPVRKVPAEVLGEQGTGDMFAPETKPTKTPIKGKSGSATPAMENVAALPTAKTMTAKAETVVRASDIVKDLDAAFAPIRTGRVNRPKAVGIFKGHAGVVRTKKANDLPTVAHETGHALQKLLWPESIGRKGRFTDKAFSPEHRAELRLLDYEPQKGRAYEGYAEFIRHYLTDPATAQQKAPKFFKFFETKIGEHPEVQAALRKAQTDIARFIEQPSAAKVRSTISYENKPNKPSARDVANRAYQVMVDELDPLRRAEEAITGGTPIKSMESAFKEAWRGRGISGKMEEWLFHGVTDKNGKKVAASLSERLKPVQGELTEWQDYAVARHALDVIDDGKAMPLSRDAYQSVVDAAPPHYQKVLESVVEYQDYVLEELVRSGMLSASAKADMRRKWPNHVPLYRDMGADLPKGMGKKQANLANPVKRLKGSGRDILPPVENIIRDTYAMLNVAQRNRVMLKLTSLAEKFGDSGRIVEKVPAKMKATSFTLDEVLTGNESILGTEKGDVSAAGIDLDTVKTIFRPNLAGSRSENIVVVYRNGKPELYQLEPGLYDAVTAADTASLGVLETLLVPFTASAKVLRAGATLDPSFAVRNPTRDLMTAMVNSESGLTPVDWVRGLFNTVGRTDLYHQFKASGAAHANLVSLDRDYLGLSVKQMRAKDAPAKVIDFVTHPIEALRALGEIGEESTRVAEFGKGTKWGKESDPSKVLDAALAARDITIDFSRTGLAGKHVNRITAFFNAAVGGADKTVRVFKQNPMRSTTRALAYITAPTVALYAINRNDKRYQDLPEWEKDMFWHIPTPNNGPMIRIPRPFEIGVVFGALPERIMRWIDKEDPHAFDQFSETMKGQLPNLMPTLLTPAWELHGNKSFTGAPIVPRSEQDLPAALQEGPDTTKTAKVIGKALDASPRKVDYAIRGYTGGLGRMANEGIIGPVASALGGDAKTVKPSKGITEAPVIKSFFVSPWQQGEDINRLYKERKRLMDKEAMEKAGQGALTPAERRALARLDSGASQLSALRKQMRQVQSENNAARLRAYAAQYGAEVADSPAQNKKAALLAIKQRMADTAAKANDK